MSSVALSCSTASSLSSIPPRESVAVLVKGPECGSEEQGVISVVPARCLSVDFSDSPLPQNKHTTMLQSLFRGTGEEILKAPEDHELHPVRFLQQPSQSNSQDVTRDYGYKYEFCDDPRNNQEEVDGNCCRVPGEGDDVDNESDEDDRSDSESLLDQAAYSPLPSSSNTSNGTDGLHHTTTRTITIHDPTDDPRIYLLGKWYDLEREYEPKRDDELSLFWLTYRSGFPEISPYDIFSDAGWGCMLRSAQMMLAQALRVHFKSRDWRSHRLSISQRRREPFLRSLLTWMADFPSASDNVYSLHNMVATGHAKYEILPGEWYGPGTACHVLRDLVHAHEIRQVALWKKKKQQQVQQLRQLEQQQQNDTDDKNATINNITLIKVPDKPIRLFRVHVAAQGSVYHDAVHELMTKESRAVYEAAKQKQSNASKTVVPDHPLASAEQELKEAQEEQAALQQLEWDTGLLLLIPLRLGLNGINEEYAKSISFTFSIPYSVGVLGGRPRGARWFYGAWSDGSRILGLDPHTVQQAPRRRTARINGKSISVVDISEAYLRSVHTTSQETVPLVRMDPSIALGFYCRSPKELQHLQDLMNAWKKANPGLPEIFSFADKSPDYENGNMISSSMMDD
ncbi:Cysteine protease ATG4B [Seminavis robusta]|uniref:Cysteine protease n=1 Tax=Seminavis robusta TaxID=568900 RepID=A0A9N8DJ41_9STRA|nr:Cysteine protease ATG4B [Seminavis robusta]|eukprot:Sro88_g046490.1 Cysteine protease ATG4B (625) ;mRNA; f:62045-64012